VVPVTEPTTIFGVPLNPAALPEKLPVNPVAAPVKLVALATPVITAPLGKVGAPVPALLVNLSALTLDITL
jgi:hypothetical protein